MTDQPRQVDINISRIPIAGVGGLGMIVVAAAIAVEFPLIRWIAVAAIVGGVLLAGVIIAVRRRRP